MSRSLLIWSFLQTESLLLLLVSLSKRVDLFMHTAVQVYTSLMTKVA